jgi:hypothetical protein
VRAPGKVGTSVAMLVSFFTFFLVFLMGLYAEERGRRKDAERALLFASGEATWFRRLAANEASRVERLAKREAALWKEVEDARGRPGVVVGRGNKTGRSEATRIGFAPVPGA